ncbi:pogo transposable element with KRAB domain-like protein, partial [Aphelenchoides avenae]
MNNKLNELYLRATFKDPGFVQGKRLLVWDSFSAHISTDTKSFLRYLQLHTAVVPGGCTKWLQVKLRELYDDWMVHDRPMDDCTTMKCTFSGSWTPGRAPH